MLLNVCVRRGERRIFKIQLTRSYSAAHVVPLVGTDARKKGRTFGSRPPYKRMNNRPIKDLLTDL